MTGFMQSVLRHLLTALGAAALAGGLGALLLWPIKKFWDRKHPDRRLNMGKALCLFLLLGWLAVLIRVTLLGRAPGYGGYANIHLLRAFRDAWNAFSQQDWLNVLLNIAMFVPLGLLLPLLSEKLQKWYWPLIAGILISGGVELLQYVSGRGLMDVDDLLCNTMGALLGGCLILSLLALQKRKPARCLGCLAVPVGFCLLMAGVLFAYQRQEYGNLPAAPSYRVRGAEFTLSCTLRSEKTEAMVYRTPAMDRSQTDGFAEEFSRAHGLNFTKKNYYDGASLYSDAEETCYLYMLHRDGSWLYQARGFREPADQNFTRKQVLEVLAPFGLTIPPEAAFGPDDPDALILTVNQLPGEGGMYDGSVRCRLSGEGKLLEMEQFLIFYPEYRREPILSPMEAWERLRRGWFSGPDWYPGSEPGAYEITGWELQYRPDTKGFYQPVYVFSANAEGSPIGGGLLVPAL